MNLRDNGFNVIVGQRPGKTYEKAVADGWVPGETLFGIEEACEKANPDIKAVLGRVVSGDQFISSKDVKKQLIEEFHGDCCEMEGAAIAHGAYLNGIPFVIIRAISDKADDSAEMDYPVFEAAAAKHSAALVKELVKNI